MGILQKIRRNSMRLFKKMVIIVAILSLSILLVSAMNASETHFRGTFQRTLPKSTLIGSIPLQNIADTVSEAAIKCGQEIQAQKAAEPKIPFFVGNSLVEGMRLNSDDGYPFCCKVGISLKELNDTLKLPDDYDIAIIEMGSNELGLYSEEQFVEEYKTLIQTLSCPCYCLSIPPCNEGKSRYAPRVNNKNVVEYNEYVQRVCEETGATYIDCSSFFGSTLKKEWTGDGLHLRPSVYAEWYQWTLDQIGIEAD